MGTRGALLELPVRRSSQRFCRRVPDRGRTGPPPRRRNRPGLLATGSSGQIARASFMRICHIPTAEGASRPLAAASTMISHKSASPGSDAHRSLLAAFLDEEVRPGSGLRDGRARGGVAVEVLELLVQGGAKEEPASADLVRRHDPRRDQLSQFRLADPRYAAASGVVSVSGFGWARGAAISIYLHLSGTNPPPAGLYR